MCMRSKYVRKRVTKSLAIKGCLGSLRRSVKASNVRSAVGLQTALRDRSVKGRVLRFAKHSAQFSDAAL